MNDLNSRIKRVSEWTAKQLTSGNHEVPIADISCLLNAAAKTERVCDVLQWLNDATNPLLEVDAMELHRVRVMAQKLLEELR